VQRSAVLAVLRQQAVDLLDLDAEQVQEGVSFKADLHVDSLALVEYTMAIEDELSIALPEEETSELITVGQFVDLIVAKTGASV